MKRYIMEIKINISTSNEIITSSDVNGSTKDIYFQYSMLIYFKMHIMRNISDFAIVLISLNIKYYSKEYFVIIQTKE